MTDEIDMSDEQLPEQNEPGAMPERIQFEVIECSPLWRRIGDPLEHRGLAERMAERLTRERTWPHIVREIRQ